MTTLDQAEARTRRAVSAFSAEVRAALLRWIMAPQAERAAIAGELHRLTDGGSIAELLIDLEEDRSVALQVADALKEPLRVV